MPPPRPHRRPPSLRRAGALLLGISWLGGIAAVLSVPASGQAEERGVFPDAASVEPLAVGRRIPSPWVRTIDGETVDLAKQLGDRGALLVFYRGGW